MIPDGLTVEEEEHASITDGTLESFMDTEPQGTSLRGTSIDTCWAGPTYAEGKIVYGKWSEEAS